MMSVLGRAAALAIGEIWTSAPMAMMELMALVTLISGVCKRRLDVPDHHVTHKAGQDKHRKVRKKRSWRVSAHQDKQNRSNASHNGQLTRWHGARRFAMAMAFFDQLAQQMAWTRGLGRDNQGRRWPSNDAIFNDRQPANGIVFHVDVDDAIFGFAKLFC